MLHEAAIRTVRAATLSIGYSIPQSVRTCRSSLSINLSRKLSLLRLFQFLVLLPSASAIGQERYIESTPRKGSFPIADATALATICVDPNDYPGVLRAANDLRDDIERVTDRAPSLIQDPKCAAANIIIVGTIGKSSVLDELSRSGKIDLAQISGKWESFLIQVAPPPLPGISEALLIAGSDKRGTIYGIYDLSEQIGVSPWYWWADVPVTHSNTVFVKRGVYAQGPPAVKYRGIFLNDEALSLTGWVKKNFSNYNHFFYEKVLELILRLKGNYLWRTMLSTKMIR